jgi:hypothetical protein
MRGDPLITLAELLESNDAQEKHKLWRLHWDSPETHNDPTCPYCVADTAASKENSEASQSPHYK